MRKRKKPDSTNNLRDESPIAIIAQLRKKLLNMNRPIRGILFYHDGMEVVW